MPAPAADRTGAGASTPSRRYRACVTETEDFGPAYERPDWAVTEEVSEGGDMVFRDGAGQRLMAVAFTEPELRLLRLGLSHLPQDEDVQTLRNKLQAE